MKTFGYGSNMCWAWFGLDVARFEYDCVAYLPGHALTFDKGSVDGTGKGNIVPGGEDDVVWGVVIDVPDDQIESLDKKERGYERETITVLRQDDHVPLEVEAYIAKPETVNPDLVPADWYLGLITAGARARGLPESYQEWLHTLPSRSAEPHRVPPPEAEC